MTGTGLHDRAGRYLPGILALLAGWGMLTMGCLLLADEPQEDLYQHPLYRNHPFGQDDTVIDLGTQPLWLPAGLILETMRHDRVLADSLKGMGMTVRFHPFLKGADVNFFLHTDKLKGGIGGDVTAITACAKDRVRITSLVELDFTSLIANRWMRVSELRGKRIGVAVGSNAHYGLLRALETVGLKEADVVLEDADVRQLPALLARGKVDAISAWEITSTLAESRGSGKVLHRVMTNGYLYFDDRFAEGHPEAVRQIIAAQLRALSWLDSSEGNLFRAVDWTMTTIREMTGKALELDREEVAREVRHSLRNLDHEVLLPESLLESDGLVSHAIDFLASQGKLPASLSRQELSACFMREPSLHVLTNPAVYHLNRFDYAGESGK